MVWLKAFEEYYKAEGLWPVALKAVDDTYDSVELIDGGTKPAELTIQPYYDSCATAIAAEERDKARRARYAAETDPELLDWLRGHLDADIPQSIKDKVAQIKADLP